MKNELVSVEIRTDVDTDPDYSFYGYWTDNPPEGSVEGGWAFRRSGPRNFSYKYFVAANPDNGPKACREDWQRMEAQENGEWSMIGVWAVATIKVGSKDFRLEQEIRSSGIWGVESNSGAGHLLELATEELQQLIDQLGYLNVGTAGFPELAAKALSELTEEVR